MSSAGDDSKTKPRSLKAIAEQAVRAQQAERAKSQAQAPLPIAHSLAPAPPAAVAEQPAAPRPAARAAAVDTATAAPAARTARAALLVLLGAAVGAVVLWLVLARAPATTAPQDTASAAQVASPTQALPTASAAQEKLTPLTSGSAAPATAAASTPAPAAEPPARNLEELPQAPAPERVAVAPQAPRASTAPTAATATAAEAAGEVKPSNTTNSASEPSAATTQPGSLPESPSVGAVQTAIGSVLAYARVCVAGEPSPSRARVSFGSDGHVQAVTVSGPAAGTPAEPCIKNALQKARVAPFNRPSYSADTTIRP
jgi:hypothetical protein